MTITDPSSIMLSERLAQGPIAGAEAQQFAGTLAEAVRRLHDQGSVLGSLEPSRIMLSGSSVKLMVGEPSTGITPYTSPEQLQGHAPDARSDIFAYGAIVYEMVSGRKAFEGSTADELRTAILEREPAPLAAEHAAFAEITAKCLAKAPLQRWQRMQRVQMELKLLTVVARRSGHEPAAKAADRMQAALSAQLAEVEARLATRIEALDAKLQAAARTEQELRAEIAALEARLGTRLDAHDTYGSRLEKLAADQDSRLAAAAQTLQAHGSSIESLESAIAQTDDLVERVVEALDSLERSFAEQHEIKTVAAPS